MHQVEYRVYYEDTDASGVMYHARYLAFFERARTEVLRDAGFSQEALLNEQGLAFTIARIALEYRRPARLDDRVLIQTDVHPRRALVEFSQRMLRDHDGELLATATVKAGCVRSVDFSPTRIPPAIVLALTESCS